MAIVLNHPKVDKQQQPGKDVEFPIEQSDFLMNVSYNAGYQQMTVTMKQGGVYVYSEITPDVLEEFTQSDDKDKYYSNVIKKNYPSQRTVDKTVGPPVKK